MSMWMVSDFEMTEGEEILRMRKKTRLRQGKIKIWDLKKKGQVEGRMK